MGMSEFREKKRHCVQCNKLYQPYQERQRFCSNNCRVKNYWKKQKDKVTSIEEKDGKLVEKLEALQKENEMLKSENETLRAAPPKGRGKSIKTTATKIEGEVS